MRRRRRRKGRRASPLDASGGQKSAAPLVKRYGSPWMLQVVVGDHGCRLVFPGILDLEPVSLTTL
jgi:hypothetical protein